MLKGSVAVAAAASLHGFTARSYGNILGANSDIRVGVIGFNGRGNSHIDAFSHMKGVRLVALCDADQAVLDKGVKRLESPTEKKKPTTKPTTKPAAKPLAKTADKKLMAGPEGTTPATKPATKILAFTDLRKLLDSKEIDAISTATPNHWHSLITIWACQAGKDVYVEKPVSHNVWEGRKMVEAARKYDRIVQTGTQSRSEPGVDGSVCVGPGGNLGKIKVVAACATSVAARSAKWPADGEVPKTVNYDLWLGPAAMEQPHRKSFHYDWHWFWAYGNGDLGNQGIHQMDTARWALGKNELAPRVLSIGGRFGYKDDGETPNTQFVVQDYGDSMLIFEVRGLPKEAASGNMDKYKGQSIGTVIECEKGYITDSGYSSDPIAYDSDGKAMKKFKRRKDAEDEAAEKTRQGRGEMREVRDDREAQGSGQGPRTRGWRRRSLRQLHQGRPQPQLQGPQGRHPGRPPLQRPVPHRQHLLSPGQEDAGEGDRKRLEGQQGGRPRPFRSVPGAPGQQRRRVETIRPKRSSARSWK
jgi:predicted dehydrogenase